MEIREKQAPRTVMLSDGSLKTYLVNTRYMCKKDAPRRRTIKHTQDEKDLIRETYYNQKYPSYSQTLSIIQTQHDIDTTYHHIRKIILEN